MERYTSNFPERVGKFELDTLEQDPHPIFAISHDFSFIYFNPAWFRFAKENQGEPAISTRFGLGTFLMDALQGEEKELYLKMYNRVMEKNEVWSHDYECSSLDEFRVFNQRIYPLVNGDGLLVINSLKVLKGMKETGRSVYRFEEKRYLQPSGFFDQCSNCRRLQRVRETDIWDWVPEMVENPVSNISHTICPTCFDFYWKSAGRS